LEEENDYLIEGDCILPSKLSIFKKKNPSEEMKFCFLAYTNLSSDEKLDLVRQHHTGEKDWTHDHSDEAMTGMIDRMIEYSDFIKKECEKYSVQYFDVSHDFSEVHDRAFRYLLG
jgi:hypothetical protein